MSRPYNILPKRTADRIAKTFYYFKGEVRWWDGRYLRNREAGRKRSKKYYAAHKEERKKYHKEYNAAHKEERKKYDKEYYRAHKEKKKKYDKEKRKKYDKEYRVNPANKERRNERNRDRYKNDENYRLRQLLRSRFTIALKSQNIKKNSHVLELTSCSIDFLRDYLAEQFEKGMSWENRGEWHIDHRKPCASFDFSDKEEQRKCFHYTNLQPLWGPENSEKGATFNEDTFEYTWVEKKGWVLRTEIKNIC